MLSEQLADAMEQVPIYVGQHVAVFTKYGEMVGEGRVDEVDHERGLVRIRDAASGSDTSYDVDTSAYNLVVQAPSYVRVPAPAGQSVVSQSVAMQGAGRRRIS